MYVGGARDFWYEKSGAWVKKVGKHCVKDWCSYDSCPDEHLFNIGRLSIRPESCAAEQVFVGRHVAVAFSFFNNSFVSGDNGRMVCVYERQTVL